MNARVVIPPQLSVNAEGKNALGLRSLFRENFIKQDALRLAFADNKEIIKAHCHHHLAAADGTQAIEGMEAALTAWVAVQCERPLGQELSSVDAQRFAREVEAAKCRELDAWCKFQAFPPVPQTKVTKDVVDTRWILT